MLFDNITPTTVIDVAPGSSIQAAVKAATPGTRINVYGTHTENVAFNAAVPTTPTAPIWLVGMDGAKIIAADKSVGKSIIAGWKCSNYVVKDLGIEDGWRGIYFGGDDANRQSNVLVVRNHITRIVEDGVKISHVTNLHVVGNTVSKCGPAGECLDCGVDVWNAWIAYNEVSEHTGTAAAIFAKAGSRDVVIEHNDVHHCKADGICAGGQSGITPLVVPYQALRVTVRKNKITFCGQNPILAKGAHDSLIADNYSESLTYSPNMVITHGNHDGVPKYSKNVEVTRNTLIGKTTIRRLDPSTANIHDNYPNPNPVTWNEPVGPSAMPTWTLPARRSEGSIPNPMTRVRS
jgi:hypothetical protein